MSYRVLARKYRPQDFTGLIGQETLVRTLTNAIAANRIPHAFILTGIRGVGKTTTARIIAKALNCEKGEIADPCGVCSNCVAIAESRHVDVMEMDAASRTGIGDIREIIDSVQYLPTMGRHKIYIIDEVHMLSKAAFNGLLKTLEEPPPHVIFVFATTEIRKIPVTILSRCMRFDLARVDTDVLVSHLTNICGKENFTYADEALHVIADAAEGSVRDSLSILDQAMALSNDGQKIEEQTVRQMLGLVGWQKIFGLLEPLLAGDIAKTLEQARMLYQAGADPVRILEDMLEIAHLFSQLKAAPKLKQSSHLSGSDITKASELAATLSISFLGRLWQSLLKGIEEVKHAPQPMMALEMALIRIAFISDLPSPTELIKTIKHSSHLSPPPKGEAAGAPKNFKELVSLFKERGEPFLHQWLVSDVYPIICEPGRLEFRPAKNAPSELGGRLSEKLKLWTGRQWIVIVSNEEGSPSLKQQEDSRQLTLKEQVMSHPAVKQILEAFPTATITSVKTTGDQYEHTKDDAASAANAEKDGGDAAKTG
jgi:DNA polymerase-3 subunit gamma/tau